MVMVYLAWLVSSVNPAEICSSLIYIYIFVFIFVKVLQINDNVTKGHSHQHLNCNTTYLLNTCRGK